MNGAANIEYRKGEMIMNEFYYNQYLEQIAKGELLKVMNESQENRKNQGADAKPSENETVQMEEMILKEGDWAEVVGSTQRYGMSIEGVVGYIESVNPDSRTLLFHMIKTKDATKKVGEQWLNESQLQKLPIETDPRVMESLNNLALENKINLALEANDKERFNSLMELKNAVG